MKSKKQLSIVFGLTADPIHLGHEQVIINSIEYLIESGIQISQFLLVPVFSPNLIADKKSPKASFNQRFQMCEIVANRLSNQLGVEIVVSDIEKQLSLKTGQKNYSYDTLSALNLDHALFVASADHFKGRWPKFRKWYQWQALVEKTGLLIHQRPGNTINLAFIKQLKQINPSLFVVKDKPSVDTSSTFIRRHFSQKTDMRGQLSADVIKYMRSQKLYS